jgi:molybdopterin/thiamine biosynthesis adenylyltransferase
MSLSDAELERYARQLVLPQVGGVGQRRLKAASVAIIGAGGIGSAVIPALAGAGIGRLTIVDDDAVELANLHRQPLIQSIRRRATGQRTDHRRQRAAATRRS